MTISTEEYRQRIGLFIRTVRPITKAKNNSKRYRWAGDNFNMTWTAMLHLLLISDLFCRPNHSSLFPSLSGTCPASITISWTSLSPPTDLSAESVQHHPNSAWHCQISINKLMKMTNGNRAKSGFKHSQWNIDKGLFSIGKLEDIKVKLLRDKPHSFCVTEANLVKNETANGRSN